MLVEVHLMVSNLYEVGRRKAAGLRKYAAYSLHPHHLRISGRPGTKKVCEKPLHSPDLKSHQPH